MTQPDYQIPPHPSGLQMRLLINEIVRAIVSQNAGPLPPQQTWPFMMWADTTAGRLKSRTADNTGWTDIGPIDDFLGELRQQVQRTAEAITSAASNKVNRSGDTIQTDGGVPLVLRIPGNNSNGKTLMLEAGTQHGDGPQIWFHKPGAKFWAMGIKAGDVEGDCFVWQSDGTSWSQGAQAMMLTPKGALWTNAYGWLEQKFLSRSHDTLLEVFNDGWYRSNGNTGWYSQTYGGGIWMSDPTWVSVYGGKAFKTEWHQFHPGGGIWTSAYGWLHERFLQRGHRGYGWAELWSGVAGSLDVLGNWGDGIYLYQSHGGYAAMICSGVNGATVNGAASVEHGRYIYGARRLWKLVPN